MTDFQSWPTSAENERAAIRKQWQAEFDDGARCGFLQKCEGVRQPGGYPKGFHEWPLARRNAWFAGFNNGAIEKQKLVEQEGAEND
jgi:hypothetical protein